MSETMRIERSRQEYINSKPSICYERAKIWTKSHKESEGEPIEIQRAKAFLAACKELPVNIFEGELIVGTAGSFRKTGILTPEFSWKWVDKEMDDFDKRPQDPYYMTKDQRDFVRKEIFPYWEGKSLEEAFLKQVPKETAKILIDTGIIDNDSKWRQAVGEITPDYEDILFPKGYKKIKEEAEEKLKDLQAFTLEDMEKINFYKSIIIVSDGIITLANRYGDKAREMAEVEKDERRKEELIEISRICYKVPENPPRNFPGSYSISLVCSIVRDNIRKSTGLEYWKVRPVYVSLL